MKTKYIFSIFAALAAAVSCQLDEDTSFISTSENFYQNKTQCLAAVNACYIPLNSLYNYTLFIAVEGTTDLAWSRSATLDSHLDISPSQPRYGATAWQQGYYGVRACNGAIAGIQGADIDASVKARYLAECKIVRAYYYWFLTSLFGDVPFYKDDVSDEATLEKVSHLPRMSADETRADLIDELQGCVEVLDKVRSSEVTDNRMGAAVGYMLIAKMAQWNKEWQTSLDALAKIEEMYGDLQEYPLSDIPFRYKNTPESIFEIQHTYILGGLSYTSNVAAICQPYSKKVASDGTVTYSGVEIPEIGTEATSWAPTQANSYLVNNLLATETHDARRAMSVVRDYNGQEFDYTKNGSHSTTAFLGPKFWCPGMILTADHNNYKVFRYADAVLMMAEAHCMLQDDVDETLRYLNMTKERAGVRLFSSTNWNSILEEIMAERGRELFGEFQRKFDLVRWGTWYERTLEETGSSYVKAAIRPCHRFYPIPDVQVAYSGYALDNNEYKQYGL